MEKGNLKNLSRRQATLEEKVEGPKTKRRKRGERKRKNPGDKRNHQKKQYRRRNGYSSRKRLKLERNN